MKKMLLSEMVNAPIIPGTDGVVAETLDKNENVVNISEARAVKSGNVIFTEEDDFIIESATVLSLGINVVGKREIATLSLLCKSKSGKLFTLCTNYLIENELEMDQLQDLPFNKNNYFVSETIVENMILCGLTSFVTDLQFSSSDDLSNTDKFTLSAVSVSKEGTGATVEFKVSTELFASLAFFDNYITECFINSYEITLAITNAYTNDHPTDIFDISKFDSILNIAATKGNTVATMFKILNEKEESVTLLAPFNVGVKFKKSKFKHCTVEKLENSFLKDSDQYLCIFICSARIKNLDKEYLIIKAKNKDNKYKLFFFDNSIREQLENAIIDF